MSVLLSDVINDALAPQVNDVLVRILGKTVMPAGSGGRHRIAAWGSFDGHQAEALLQLAGHPKSCGALVIADDDAERVLYLDHGRVVGSRSSVLFELLGRVLYQSVVVEHSDSDALIEVEESQGPAALKEWLPEEVLAWAVEQRVGTVAAALPYIRKGQFAWVQGQLDLEGLPTVQLDPRAVVEVARQRYVAWRAGEKPSDDEARAPDTPAALQSPLRPKQAESMEPEGMAPEGIAPEGIAPEGMDPEEIYRRIREADLGFK